MALVERYRGAKKISALQAPNGKRALTVLIINDGCVKILWMNIFGIIGTVDTGLSDMADDQRKKVSRYGRVFIPDMYCRLSRIPLIRHNPHFYITTTNRIKSRNRFLGNLRKIRQSPRTVRILQSSMPPKNKLMHILYTASEKGPIPRLSAISTKISDANFHTFARHIYHSRRKHKEVNSYENKSKTSVATDFG